MRRLGPTLVIALVLLTACGTGTSGPDASGAPDITGRWTLVSGHDGDGGNLALSTGDGPVEVTLDLADGEVSGTSGCNHYFGQVEKEGDRVDLTGLGGTEMGCAPEVMDLEGRYLAALEGVDHAARDADRLSLTGGGAALVFALVPVEPDADLAGPVWRLESLLEADTASSTAAPGSVTLDSDGRLRGEGGCGTFTAHYTVAGPAVSVRGFRDLSQGTGRCAPDRRVQHDHVVDVLRGGFTFTIDGAVLTLTGPDGKGLQLRAR